jgi:hypothetical protein
MHKPTASESGDFPVRRKLYKGTGRETVVWIQLGLLQDDQLRALTGIVMTLLPISCGKSLPTA